MKKLVIACLLCLFTLPVFAKNSILIIGDSLSAAHGIDSNLGWVALLKNRLKENNYNYDVINASISGDTTSQGLARLPNALQQFKPSVTIIELGGNDGLRGLPIATIENNLRQMISLIKKSGSHVLLLGVRLPPNYGMTYTNQFHKMFADLAKQNQISVVPLFLGHIDKDNNLMQADKIHPTVKAQSMMLNNVWPTLILLLKK
jgi:acyl-CoA thioesterase-1